MDRKKSQDPEFEKKKLAKADEIIGRYRNTLRELADATPPADSPTQAKEA